MADGLDGAGSSGRTDTSQWRENLPDELKNDPSLKDIKDPVELAKSFINAQKMIGNSIRPPGPDATPEAVKKFQDDLKAKIPGLVAATDTDALWASLGRPKTADAYVPPENVKLPDEDIMSVRKFALENGYTVEQAKPLFKARAQAREDALAKTALWNEELKREWGTATEERKALAIVAAEKMGAPPALVEAARTGQLDPGQMKWLYSVAKAVGPGEGNNLGTGPTAPRQISMTPEEAEAQIAELQKDPAWRNEADPRHQQKIMKMVELVEIANAGKALGDNDFGQPVGHIVSMTGIAPDKRR